MTFETWDQENNDNEDNDNEDKHNDNEDNNNNKDNDNVDNDNEDNKDSDNEDNDNEDNDDEDNDNEDNDNEDNDKTKTTAYYASNPCLPCLGIISRTFLEHMVLFIFLRWDGRRSRILWKPDCCIFVFLWGQVVCISGANFKEASFKPHFLLSLPWWRKLI